MSETIGWIVRSIAGHDKGELFCVIGQEENFFLLADGKGRKVAQPKRKKQSHVDIVCQATPSDDTIIQMLRRHEPVSDRALRRWLAAFKGGNHPWQKTI